MLKNMPAKAGDASLNPGLGRFPGEGCGYPLQYSCLENSMDRGTCQAIAYGITRVGHDLTTKRQIHTQTHTHTHTHTHTSILSHFAVHQKHNIVSQLTLHSFLKKGCNEQAHNWE